MVNKKLDIAIIGGGTAGMSALRAVREYTDSVALIEAEHFGTTCARVGCMPSKLLIAAGEAAHNAHGAHRFGVSVKEVRVDSEAVMRRVRFERDRFVGFVLEAVKAWPQDSRIVAKAEFLDANTLALSNGDRIEAQRIVIASGSSPRIPPAWRQALGDRLIVNNDVFNWERLPSSIAVIGAGVIGLELATALHQLGVRVKLFARNGQVGSLTSPDMKALSAEVIGNKLPVVAFKADIAPRREGDQVLITWQDAAQQTRTESFDFMLAAIGRVPNTQGIGLEKAGVKIDVRGHVEADPMTMQTNMSHIFLAGDAKNDRPLLHEAADEGRIAGDNAGRFPGIRAHARRTPLAIVFSDPQIAVAGASHASLLASGSAFIVGKVSFVDQGRSRVILKNEGAMEVYADHVSGRFLGAEILGPAAEHIAHLLAWSVQRGDTVQQMLDSPFYHPVVEEGLRTALRDLCHNLKMGPAPVARCLDCGPGA